VSVLRFPRVVLVVACLYFLGIAGLFAVARHGEAAWVRTASHTTGTVIALVPKPLAGSDRQPAGNLARAPIAPRVRYTVDGVSHTYTPEHGRIKTPYRIGSQVDVLYHPGADPERVQLAGESRLGLPLVAVGFGLLAVAMLVLLIILRRVPFVPPARRRRGPAQPALAAAAGQP